MKELNTLFETKIAKMSDEQVDQYIENLFDGISNKNIAEALAIADQMKIINRIRF